jgi:drug/metabolite transporter (DMT)-like permease
LSKNSMGALLLGLSVLAFSVMSTLAKFLGNDFNAIQIVFFRALFSLFIIAPSLIKAGTVKGGIRTSVPALQITRGLVGAIAITLSFYAIINMPLADALAIRFSSALFVVPLAAVFLKENMQINKILASAVGFFGVLIMLNPGGNIPPAGLAALGAAIAFALATILVSIVARYDKPITMMFYSNIVAVILLIGPAVMVWRAPNLEQFSLLICMAISASIAHNLFIRAFAIAEASVIAPIDYLRLLLGAAIDYFIFGVVLGSNTLMGSMLIVVAAYFILRAGRAEHAQKPPAQSK